MGHSTLTLRVENDSVAGRARSGCENGDAVREVAIVAVVVLAVLFLLFVFGVIDVQRVN